MPLAKSVLKDLKNQVPTVDEKHLPSMEDRKAFLEAQIESTKKVVYRTVVDLELAEKFATLKDEGANETAKQRFAEGTAQLKAYIPSLEVLEATLAELRK